MKSLVVLHGLFDIVLGSRWKKIVERVKLVLYVEFLSTYHIS